MIDKAASPNGALRPHRWPGRLKVHGRLDVLCGVCGVVHSATVDKAAFTQIPTILIV